MFQSFQLKGGLKAPLLFLLFFLVCIPAVYAVGPPITEVTQISQNSLQLAYPKYDTIFLNEERRFHVHVINQSRAKTNLTTSCAMHLYNLTGWDVELPHNGSMEFEVSNGIDFALTVTGGNFSQLGVMTYVIQCNSTNEVGFASGQLTVNAKAITTPSATSDWRIFLILILFAFSLLVFSLYSKNYYFSFFTGLAFVLAGIYTMIYGFDSVTDLYTRAIGLILIGIGGILTAISIYNLMRSSGSSNDEGDEDSD